MSKGGGSSTTNTIAEPWSAAQPFLRNLLGDAQDTYSAGLFDQPTYPGIRVAPQSNLTQAGMQGFYDIGTQGNPITPQAQAAFGDIVGGQNIYNDLGAVKQSVLGDVLPAVSSRFGQAGMLDSTLAADAMSRAATQAIAPIEYGAWDAAQNRRTQALGMSPQLAANAYLDPQMLSMAGQQQDAYGQRLLDSAIGNYYEEAGRPYSSLERAASLGMGFGGMGGTQSGATKEPGGGTLGTIGSLVQTLGPIIAMAAMSDRRLKTDIKRIGKSREGYPTYLFRYHWDAPGTVRYGVMADEVLPEITIDIGGYKAVNYAEVTL